MVEAKLGSAATAIINFNKAASANTRCNRTHTSWSIEISLHKAAEKILHYFLLELMIVVFIHASLEYRSRFMGILCFIYSCFPDDMFLLRREAYVISHIETNL